MFEPVHGSAPDIAGQQKADPTAAILSTALLLDHLGYADAAAAVEAAVIADLAERQPGAARRTSEVGDAIAAASPADLRQPDCSTRWKAATLMSMEISTTLSEHPVDDARLAEILANPGFGTHFTDHMFTVEWTPEEGWHDARVEPYGPLTLDPATAVLHYAQEIFEGMKAYRHEDGSIWAFRPEENAARMSRSSHRLALPELESTTSSQAVDALVERRPALGARPTRARRASTSGRSCSPPSRSSGSGPRSTSPSW